MSKSKRLLELILFINRKRKFTAREVAEEFKVSIRTIQRDLIELSELGVPLYSEVGSAGGYSVLNERVLPPIAFTEREAIAMFFSYQSLKLYSAVPFGEESISALNKFYSFLPKDTKAQIDEMRNRIVFWTPKRNIETPYLELMLKAAIEQKVVSVEYSSKKEIAKREIQPLGLYSENGYWYCPAYCFKREVFRLFRVDYILRAEIKEEYKVKKDFTNLSIYDWFEPQREQDAVRLLVKLTKEGIRKCELNPWLENAIKLQPNGSGVIDILVTKKEMAYNADFFFGIGSDAQVIEPYEMVELIKEKIKSISSAYGI